MPLTLLFDMDGTLVHSDPLHAAVFIDMLAEYGIAMTEERYLSEFLGRRNPEIFAMLLPDEDPHALDVEKERRFRTRLDEIAAPAVGAEALLRRARDEGWRTALVTNACRENAEAVLARFALADYFDAITLGEDCSRGKPDPEVYVTAMQKLGADAGDCIAFEDSPTGLAASTGAQVFTIGLTSSLTAERLRDCGANATIADFTDPVLEPLLRSPKGHHP